MNWSVRRIAREAGVSIATVSRVANNEGGVSEALRRKTRAVLRRHAVPAPQRAPRIAVMGAFAEVDPFFSTLLTGVGRYAAEEGVEALLALGSGGPKGRERTLLETLRARRCDAALHLTVLPRPEEAREVAAAGLPLFLLANRSEVPEVGFLDGDSRGGAEAATDYLLSLGHRRIGFLAGELPRHIDHRERLAGFRRALRRAGIAPDPEREIAHEAAPSSEEGGYRQALRLLDRAPRVTALLANNDGMAVGALHACRERGLRVPRDLSVVGFDDLPQSRFAAPPLTTVRLPLAAMAHEAMGALHAFVQGRIARLHRRVVPAELIVRASCGPAPRR